MTISAGRFQPVHTPTVIRSLLQQFPYWYPFISCFARTDSVFIYETELPLVECGYDGPISFPLPSLCLVE